MRIDYSIYTYFPNHKVAPDKLAAELAVLSPPVGTLQNISTSPGTIMFFFAEDSLSGSAISALEAAMAAHDGLSIREEYKTHQPICLNTAIITDSSWSTIGGVLTNISTFVPDLDEVIGRVQMQIKTTDALCSLQILENDTNVLGSASLPNTSDAWTSYQFDSTVVPVSGVATYAVQGKTTGASASIRFASLVLLEREDTSVT